MLQDCVHQRECKTIDLLHHQTLVTPYLHLCGHEEGEEVRLLLSMSGLICCFAVLGSDSSQQLDLIVCHYIYKLPSTDAYLKAYHQLPPHIYLVTDALITGPPNLHVNLVLLLLPAVSLPCALWVR